LKLRAKRDTLVAEIEALTQDTSSLGDQQKAAAKAVERMEEEAAKLAETVKALKAAHEDASAQVEAKKKMLAEALAEIRALYVEVDNANKTFQTAELEIKELTHKRETFEKDQKDLVKLIAALVKANPWITQEKSLFGVEGSDYDFAATDVNACLKRLKDIKVQQEQISKKINKKVMGMIEKAESEYTDLTKKREVILNDKAKIEDVIAELDVKKMQALQSTWVKVNRDFGSIFSMLLPGTHAKLDPPEGQTVTDGLEVKVAFNGTWKESLTELSGGQRSLLALSLILALLLFKPAPMYILDEVDAALDLSHTQNIGTMLRTHFQHSQFIVVSLKEGMFNNANVIFRTRFVDGVSAVIRTAGKPRSTAELAALESKKNEINAENALVVAKKTAKKPAKKAGKADGENTKPNLVEA
jgi:structural maintenance of chromosome 2